ncbi:MAG: hypothetical protein LBD69_02290 [Puniceicoccales bacterium]|jgi:hypothetical protein|nr:hypothetical protein [Puniceicoccales bacterium]
MYEARLSAIFVQQTQGYYLMENAMHLVRDYAYQLTQTPKMPNIFLGVDAYRRKANSGVINFNTSFAKTQIAPADFPLQPGTWEVFGGPIFWQDKKKDANDERYLSEVFLLLDLSVVSNFVPNWTMRMVQLMEIERNPLCDFQIYSEEDTAYCAGHISDTSALYFQGPIQINGNFRIARYRHISPALSTYFLNRFNIAGHLLRIQQSGESYSSIAIPSKYGLYDNSAFYNSYTNPYSVAANNVYLQNYRIGSSQSNNHGVAVNTNYYSNATDTFDKDCMLSWWYGNVTTRGRIYRPTGFDPIAYSGWWYPNYTTVAGATNEHVVDLCAGLYNLCNAINYSNSSIYNGTNIAKVRTAFSTLRGLTNQQITEKARLIESQKPGNFPSLLINVLVKQSAQTLSFTPTINFPYVTYSTTHFPAAKDNIYVKTYLNFVDPYTGSSLNNLINSIEWIKVTRSGTSCYYLADADTPNSDSFNAETQMWFTQMSNNKLAVHQLSVPNGISSSFTFIKLTTETAGTITDTSAPPAKLVDYGTYWRPEIFDNKVARVYIPSHYNFIYDRNRAKWIQLLDFDVAAFITSLTNGSPIGLTSFQNDVNSTVFFNRYWLGKRNGDNYKAPANTSQDIRTNYIASRTTFLNSYNNGSYVYPSTLSPVLDFGIRIINASTLPAGGLSIVCPFPLYIKGNFNTTNTQPKAFIAADSITLLTDNWQDWSSGTDAFNSYLRNPLGNAKDYSPSTRHSIYAHVMTGTTHPDFWLKDNKNVLNPDLGIQGVFRSLEYIAGGATPILQGSLMLPYYCKMQWEPPINFASKVSPQGYCPLGFMPSNNFSSMRPTKCMPFYHRINRGRKTQTIGDATYNVLKNIYNAETTDTSYTMTTYTNALPNYLK